MKKGITAMSITILVVILLILAGTITISVNNTIQNSKKLAFALELSNIQEEVDNYVEENNENSPLPDEYQEVEYIIGNKTDIITKAYINTGVIATKLTRCELSVYISGSVNASACLLGARKNGNYDYYVIQSNVYANSGHVAIGGYGSAIEGTISGSFLDKKVMLDVSINGVYRDGVKSLEGNTNIRDFSTPGPLILNGMGNGTEIALMNQQNIKYYSVKIYSDYNNDSSLVREFVPCYRRSDGVVGMYDLCGSISEESGTSFYYSLGSDKFNNGPEVLNTKYPIKSTEIEIDLSDVSNDMLSQFANETKTNNKIKLYELDLSLLGITDTIYGNKKESEDVYAISKQTGKVYYLKGVKASSKTYYTLTDNLIKINEKNYKQDNNVQSSQVVEIMPGAYEYNIEGNNITDLRITGITATGNDIVKLKYEKTFIPENKAKSYFAMNGKDIADGNIYMDKVTYITIYAEDKKGNYQVQYVDSETMKGKRLPSDYKEVNYIESTGTEYIDSNIQINKDTRIVLDVQITSSGWFFGYKTAAQASGFAAEVTLGGNTACDYYGERKSFSSISGRNTYDFKGRYVYVNNQLKLTHTATTDTTTYPLYLFKPAGDYGTITISSLKLYNCKIYNDDTLIRYFIPCYCTTNVIDVNGNECSTGTAGMYDLVTGEFYTNQGDGTFIVGEDVN